MRTQRDTDTDTKTTKNLLAKDSARASDAGHFVEIDGISIDRNVFNELGQWGLPVQDAIQVAICCFNDCGSSWLQSQLESQAEDVGSEGEHCPRCGDALLTRVGDTGALSHTDNKTLVCSDCGEEEAWHQHTKGVIGADGYLLPLPRTDWVADKKATKVAVTR